MLSGMASSFALGRSVARFARPSCARPTRCMIVALAWIGFAVQFGPFAGIGGLGAAGVVIFVPVGVTAWAFGLTGGAWAGVVSFPIQALMLHLYGGHVGDLFDVGYLVAHFTLLLFGLALGYSRDITGRYREELLLRQAAEEELRRLVDSKDEFVAAISHELRTPLTTVAGLVAELRWGNTQIGEDEYDELLALIDAGASDLSYIVEDLLVAARAELGHLTVVLEEIALGAVASATAAEMGAHGMQSVEVTGEATAIGDAARVRQVVRNLLSNAHRYGGDDVRMRVGSDDLVVFVEVSDDGGGVAEEIRERIFEPYVAAGARVHPKSIGIGLDVCRTLATLMEGSVTYLRTDGRTVFRLSLPAAP